MDNSETAAVLIRVGVGITMLAFGISQQKSPEKWLKYIPGFFRFIMPMQATSFMRVHSLGNLSLGLLMVIGLWQPIIIWLALAWWLWVLPFAFYAEFSMGMRDFSIVMALIALLS